MENNNKKFKVLLVYPNGFMMNPPPVSYGIFTALLMRNGYEVDLFDTTLYRTPNSKGSDEMKESTLQVRPFSYESRSVVYKNSDCKQDLANKISNFNPGGERPQDD